MKTKNLVKALRALNHAAYVGIMEDVEITSDQYNAWKELSHEGTKELGALEQRLADLEAEQAEGDALAVFNMALKERLCRAVGLPFTAESVLRLPERVEKLVELVRDSRTTDEIAKLLELEGERR